MAANSRTFFLLESHREWGHFRHADGGANTKRNWCQSPLRWFRNEGINHSLEELQPSASPVRLMKQDWLKLWTEMDRDGWSPCSYDTLHRTHGSVYRPHYTANGSMDVGCLRSDVGDKGGLLQVNCSKERVDLGAYIGVLVSVSIIISLFHNLQSRVSACVWWWVYACVTSATKS